MRLHVIATTDEGTRRALVEAERLSVAFDDARFVVLVPRASSFPDAGDFAALTDRYRRLVSETGVPAVVRICVTRRGVAGLQSLLGDGSTVVIGGRRRWWWPTSAQRIAGQLTRRGHRVVFAEVVEQQLAGPSACSSGESLSS